MELRWLKRHYCVLVNNGEMLVPQAHAEKVLQIRHKDEWLDVPEVIDEESVTATQQALIDFGGGDLRNEFGKSERRDWEARKSKG